MHPELKGPQKMYPSKNNYKPNAPRTQEGPDQCHRKLYPTKKSTWGGGGLTFNLSISSSLSFREQRSENSRGGE